MSHRVDQCAKLIPVGSGKNALDAAVLAYTSIACLRQHIQTTERVHCIITNGGDAVNGKQAQVAFADRYSCPRTCQHEMLHSI